MALPPAVRAQLAHILRDWQGIGFTSDGDENNFLIRTAEAEPSSVVPHIQTLVYQLNSGRIRNVPIRGCLGLLVRLSEVAEYLRTEIDTAISKELLEYYCEQTETERIAKQLAEVLKIGRPQHYFDIARNIRISNGCILVIGAGFSYDSYTPLLQEMEGIVCSSLYDLGIEDPRGMYQSDNRKAWEIIRDLGWGTFQQHVSAMVLPKVPSPQHLITAELFQTGLIQHIVSFNWDDLVEKAYRSRFGSDIPKIVKDGTPSSHAYWKLHGDVQNPKERWVLPYEEGRVFDALIEVVRRLTLPSIIVGYREQEPQVKSLLLSLLDQRGGAVRIRPDAPHNPPNFIADDALAAMKRLKSALESAAVVQSNNAN